LTIRDARAGADNIKLINWDKPESNFFTIAEEVTLRGNHERRPDLVLYINGIAIGVIELKNNRSSISDGFMQLTGSIWRRREQQNLKRSFIARL